MKKVNLNKVTELINNQVSNSLKEVKASKTQKPKETKESKAKEEPKAKLVKTTTKKGFQKRKKLSRKLPNNRNLISSNK